MLYRLLQPQVLVFLIPIVAIVGGYIIKSQKMRQEHEERLAKIEAGMDPDEQIDLTSLITYDYEMDKISINNDELSFIG